MIKLKALAVFGAVAALLAVPASSAAAVAPEGAGVQLVTLNGSGCPDQTGTATLTPEGIGVTFSGFTALPGVPAPACTFVFRVTAPAGSTYSVTGGTYTGQIDLPAGSSGVFRQSYRFQGSLSASVEQAISGPLTGGWTVDGALVAPLAAPASSRFLVVTDRMAVSDDEGASLSLDGAFTVGLAWS